MTSQSLKDTCKWLSKKHKARFDRCLHELEGFLKLPETAILEATGHHSKRSIIDAYTTYFLFRMYIVPVAASPLSDYDTVREWIKDRFLPKDKL